ncbi:MAG: stage II sporulation protein M [Candidatus Pacearchaeota archaeon]
MKKKKFSLINEYKNSWKYIVKSKKFIFFIIGLFFVFALIGFLFYNQLDTLSSNLLGVRLTQIISDFTKRILEQTKGMSQLDLTLFIFSNNIQSSFLGVLFGFVYGIFPLISGIMNGYVLGWALANYGGISSIWKILPHGIFELPAIFISLGLGLKFGTFMFQKNKAKSFKNYLINSLRVFLLVIIPLLILAGIIEGSLICLS